VVVEVAEVERAWWAAITAAVVRALALVYARRAFVDEDGNCLVPRLAPPS
jgi:hypothetical protein